VASTTVPAIRPWSVCPTAKPTQQTNAANRILITFVETGRFIITPQLIPFNNLCSKAGFYTSGGRTAISNFQDCKGEDMKAALRRCELEVN
jgi:hypothetical protein